MAKFIGVYDYDDDRIESLCNKYDLSTYELIEILLDELDESTLKRKRMKTISQVQEDRIFINTGRLEEVIGVLQSILEDMNALMYVLDKQEDK